LLALLALAAGRVVPVPALIDALWGDRRRPGADPVACRAHPTRAGAPVTALMRAVGIPGGAFE
jgi:hypothetical protein